MNLVFIDSQRDIGGGSNGSIAVVGIVNIYDSNNALLKSFTAKDNPVGFISSTYQLSYTGDGFIEVINPNLFSCDIQFRPYWFNPNTGFSQESLSALNMTILPATSQKVAVNFGSYTNIYLETYNRGFNATPLYTIETAGNVVASGGTDLDGLTVPAGKEFYPQIKFKKISDGSYTTLLLDNKKMRETSPAFALVDTSAYIPYIAPSDSTIIPPPPPPPVGQVTPVISKIDDVSVRWETPTFVSAITRSVDIYVDDVFFRADTYTMSGTVNIINLPTGSVKIKYSTSLNSAKSEFSNAVQLSASVSIAPVVRGFETAIKADGFAIVTITAGVGAVVHFQDSNGNDFVVGTVDQTGTITHSVQNAGNYTYSQIEVGKTVSTKTAPITINPYTAMPTCQNSGDFSIASAVHNATANTLTFQYNASNFQQGTYAVKNSSNVSVYSGNLSPTANTITLNAIILTAGTFTLQLDGVSCTGTATKTFTVTGGTGGLPSCDNGNTPFAISSVVYNQSANTLSYVVNASNLNTSTWRILQGTTPVQTGTTTHVSSTVTISSVQTLTAGNYTIEVTGSTCTGMVTGSFTVGTQATTKTFFASAKLTTTACLTSVLQFGYSASASVVPSVWADATTSKRLLNTNGVITEVTTGGDVYQTKQFDLNQGATYHLFCREKTVPTNVSYLGSITL